jgi:hypothetical protein
VYVVLFTVTLLIVVEMRDRVDPGVLEASLENHFDFLKVVIWFILCVTVITSMLIVLEYFSVKIKIKIKNKVKDYNTNNLSLYPNLWPKKSATRGDQHINLYDKLVCKSLQEAVAAVILTSNFVKNCWPPTHMGHQMIEYRESRSEVHLLVGRY